MPPAIPCSFAGFRVARAADVYRRLALLPLLASVSLASLSTVATAAPAVAQTSPATQAVTRVEGRVQDGDGRGVASIEVTLTPGATPTVSTPAADAVTHTTLTDPEGWFRFASADLAAGPHHVVARLNGQAQSTPVAVDVVSGALARTEITLTGGFLEEVTVSDLREARLVRETPASVGIVDRRTIAAINPTHPSQVLSQVAGVWVNNSGGEGHMTAIRQPLTTSPVYLFLEDGVPTRSTGFFNHNAMYEVNVPAAESIEVTKGPSSALYGSDAIGGVINVLSRSALAPTGVDLDTEGGPYGWRRLMAGGTISSASGTQGLRADVNLTHTDGWRASTGYDRRALSARWDRATSASLLKTLISYSTIEQAGAGSSALNRADYANNPRRNLAPIGLRGVKAFRASTDYQRLSGTLFTNVTPYVRYNTLDLLAPWALSFDPTFSQTHNASFGVLAKASKSLRPWRTQIVGGFDLDVSPGGREEQRIMPTTERTENGQTLYADYTPGPAVYDYDVRFIAASPYINLETSPLSRLRASVGVRYDRVSYTYDDRLDTPQTPRHQRPPDASLSYDRVSPKLGLTWRVSDRVNVFTSYRHAFRVPSEGQIFRQGSSQDTLNLRPVKAVNTEIGVRAAPMRALSLEASLYRLEKRDDILSFRRPEDGATEVVNAGRTRHQGVELTADVTPREWLRVHLGYTHASHRYADWLLDPVRNVDYSGKVIETAPRDIADLTMTVAPAAARWSGSLQVNRIGRYWMDALNTHEYEGHTLLHLRGAYRLTNGLELFARVLNLTDARYAETSSYTLARGEELSPGLPRTAYVGVHLSWKK